MSADEGGTHVTSSRVKSSARIPGAIFEIVRRSSDNASRRQVAADSSEMRTPYDPLAGTPISTVNDPADVTGRDSMT
jgi:hypothetical protein